MGLFFRREETNTELPYRVNIGMENTKLIVGLGNPGKKYDLTRHNIGFYCLDRLAETENGQWSEKKALQSLVCDLQLGSSRILLCKPQTFMNNSGEAVRAVQSFFKLETSNILVVHDEIDVVYGKLRMQTGGSDAGHNGIKSVSQHLGKDYGRIRVGIGPKTPPKIDSADFVLQKFSKEEQGHLGALSTEVTAIINEFVFGGQLAPETRKFL